MSTRSEKSIRRTLARLQRKGGAALWVAMVAPLVGGGLLVWQAWTLAHILVMPSKRVCPPIPSSLPSVLILVGLLIARAGLGALASRLGLPVPKRSSSTCAVPFSRSASRFRLVMRMLPPPAIRLALSLTMSKRWTAISPATCRP